MKEGERLRTNERERKKEREREELVSNERGKRQLDDSKKEQERRGHDWKTNMPCASVCN